MRKISLFIFFLVVPVSFIEAAISYIVTVQYNGTSASVHIPDEVSGVVRCISGTSSHVLLGQSSNTNNNQDEIIYALSGNTDDGEFSLSSTDNLTLNLKGLTLKNPRGEAIHVMGKRVKVSLAADTENMLSDGNGAVVEEGCFHCDGHTEFMGKGTLTVLSNMWCAIYSKEYLTLKNCTINVIGSMKDGVYCQEYFKMSSGVLKIDNVKDNGIKVEKRISNSNSQTNENSGNFYMTDGLLSIKNVGGDCIKTSGTITHSGGIFDFDTTNIKENSTETIIVPDFCIVNTGEVCAFFESPGNWTNTIHCWAWKDSPSENFTGGNWPGASCTLLGTAPNGNKVWKWIWDGKKQENSSAMQPAKIIFNNNGQPQTDDQTFTLGGYYNKYGLQGYAGESVVPSTPTDYSKQPFTIVAHNEDVTIRMVATTSEVFEDTFFSTDKGQTWTFFGNTDLFYKVIPANTTLSLKGNFLGYLSTHKISGGTFDVEGNIMSLTSYNKWETKTGAGGLKGLFSGHTNLVSAENLILPATTLAEGCYDSMFAGCTSLTTAPALPATSLAKGCYATMFYGCTNLTTAPQLPATTLAEDCYTDMFLNCTSLTKAPQLPATTLASGCYAYMFRGCTSLTTAPDLPATLLTNNCYTQMFEGCTSLTTAPELPATALAKGCYQKMFSSCKLLNYVKCLATNVSADNCTTSWLYNVSSSGTFVKASSMNNWPSGSSGIPSGWTVESYKPSVKRTIHVATAGTLPNLISEDEKYEIEELTLTGRINGTDIILLRDMAGIINNRVNTKSEGKLKKLDLSEVTIVSGGQPYEMKINGDWQEIITNDNCLPQYVFYLSVLSEVVIPNSVTSIGSCAFSGCNLTSINIPNSVTSLGDFAFSSGSLTSIKVEDDNPKYDSRNNCNAIIDSNNQLILGCKNTIIPNSVTSIGNNAFDGCKGLTSITIPNSVTSIDNYAFFNCSNLASIIIPNSVSLIDSHAFGYCNNLTTVTIPNSVTIINAYAFQGCSSLTTITIPNSVTSIGSLAFYDCKGLKKVISKIEKPFTISSDVFSCIPSDAELIVPAGTKSLYEATEGWNKFSKITTEHLPTLETLPAQPTSTTKARLIALANEEDDEQHFGFEWLRNDAPANMPANKVSAPLYDGRIIGSLGGLNPDIYYKYRPFYKSDSGEMAYGEWIPFLTGDANVFFEPEVHTKEAIVSNDGALLSAVFVEGTEDIQEKGFEYWQKNSNARAVSLTRGNNIGSVIVSGNNTSVTIEGLKAGTEYGYRSYVKTASGITYGEEKTFKTSMFGDVNGDNKVDSNDLNDLVSYIMGIIPPHFNKDVADLNNDNKVNAADVVKMVNILK